MKALMVGGGSIGKRHLKNLLGLAIGPLAIVEPDASRRSAIVGEFDIPGFELLEQGLAWSPAFVAICSPPHLHVNQAIQVAAAGAHLFVEKPLSVTLDGLAELDRLVAEKGIVSLVGCNMRFHPGPATLKRLLGEGHIGRPLFGRLHTGSFLPEWRPGVDYRSVYSSRAAEGGGVILDCIHEIDLARWYLGDVTQLSCTAARLGNLAIDAEDYAALSCAHVGGAHSEVHLDYLQRTYERGCQISGENGSLFWDYRQGEARMFVASSNEWSSYGPWSGWDVNEMYLEEMRHFLKAVAESSTTALPVRDAIQVMRVALAAKESARMGRVVALDELRL